MITERDKLLKKATKDYFKNEIHSDIIYLLQSVIDEDDDVLDIGCGLKLLTCFLRCNKLTGIDGYKNYLTNKDIFCDITQIDNIISKKTYDVVLAIDVIEHLEKDDGYKLLNNLFNIAKKCVVVFTPTIWKDNKDAVININNWSYGNVYNYHKSLWKLEELTSLGFVEFNNFNYKNKYIFAFTRELVNQ